MIDYADSIKFIVRGQSKKLSKLIPIHNSEKNFWLENSSKSFLRFAPFYSKFYKMMTRGVKDIRISGFILKKKHFQSIVSHTRNLEYLQLQECKIETSGAKFIDKNYKLKEIDLTNCGSPKNSDWVNNPEGFLSFLTAIERCSIKNPLKTISFRKLDFIDEDIIDRFKNMGIELKHL
mmetsp:Transcript_2671/g.2251  ORF Transcript_2671/g.2251 Transcript_2671/m.2251 type:complete len:177 (+) Transcript_2671:212-742(+)